MIAHTCLLIFNVTIACLEYLDFSIWFFGVGMLCVLYFTSSEYLCVFIFIADKY